MLMKLSDIQPSQLYINADKLTKVLKWFNPDEFNNISLPVINLDGKVTFTDGYTRALTAYINGFDTINVYWDEDNLDMNHYRTFVGWCTKEGITTIANLKDRIIKKDEYNVLWINRCKAL